MDSNFKQKWEEYRSEFENVLADYLERMQIRPPVLNDSFRYSLALGGKRFRPVLMFACARSLGGKPGDVAGFALALEMLPTYSLIHDDLPAMDNDNFRRGKPSNHKVFGEGQAILAGDALLNEAYSVCFEECRKGKTYLNAAAEICKNAGVGGMIAGQAADLFFEQKEAGKAEEDFIILHKTAKMIVSAAVVPALVYGADENIAALFAEFGKHLGILFQLTDDILDVTGDFEKLGKTLGKDASEGKLTSVRVCGLDKCKELAEQHRNICRQILDDLPYDCSFLSELTDYVLNRDA